jgi:hypothetical protein
MFISRTRQVLLKERISEKGSLENNECDSNNRGTTSSFKQMFSSRTKIFPSGIKYKKATKTLSKLQVSQYSQVEFKY